MLLEEPRGSMTRRVATYRPLINPLAPEVVDRQRKTALAGWPSCRTPAANSPLVPGWTASPT